MRGIIPDPRIARIPGVREKLHEGEREMTFWVYAAEKERENVRFQIQIAGLRTGLDCG